MEDVDEGKVKCTECGWHGWDSDCREVLNYPVCPKCEAIDHFVPLCEHPGCLEPVCVGWKWQGQYYSTCHEHYEGVG